MDRDIRSMLHNLQLVSPIPLAAYSSEAAIASRSAKYTRHLDQYYRSAWSVGAMHELLEDAPAVREVLAEFGVVFRDL